MLQRLNTRPSRMLMTLDAVGGVWRYAMDLAASLAPQGIRFLFVGLGPEPTAAQRAQAEQLGELIWLDIPPDWLADSPQPLDALPTTLQALARNIDLMHLNAPSQAAGLSVDVPVVAVSHSCVPSWFAAVRNDTCPPDWSWQHTRNRDGLVAADVIVAPSQSHGAALRACYGDVIGEIAIVNNGSGTPAKTAAAKHPYVVAAARWWDDGKNGRVLDAAAPLIDWPLHVAGATHGPNGASIAFENIACLGTLPADHMQHEMAAASIVVSPSVYEPFGLVPLEGAKAGAALVLADIATYRELWDGAALFADPHSPDAFATAINQVIADPARRAELGRSAQQRAARYTLEAQAEAMWDLYTHAAAQHTN